MDVNSVLLWEGTGVEVDGHLMHGHMVVPLTYPEALSHVANPGMEESRVWANQSLVDTSCKNVRGSFVHHL